MTYAKKGGFDLHTFVTQSCLIDPQYADRDMCYDLLPARKPGQLMYDNSVRAFNFAAARATEPVYEGLAKDIHRELTRSVPWFEDRGLSGRYRNEELEVGGYRCPRHIFVDFLIRERWIPKIKEELESFDGTKEHALKIAWGIHHSFEYIHPFADGNGRTGRLLLNYALMAMGQEPIVVWYKHRFKYYKEIQKFKQNEVDEYLSLKKDWPV